jgi:hypothetical protein
MANMCERVFRTSGPPWADTERYVRNSPIFFSRTDDGAFDDRSGRPRLRSDLAGGRDVLSALALGKKVRFVRCWDEGHVLGKAANIEDLWKNISDWLEEH